MKEIKTRNKKGIKGFNKSISLSVRMKNAYVRTKEAANETQNPRNSTPTEYATANIQNAAKTAQQTAKAAERSARATAKATAQAIKVTVRAIIATVKAAGAAAKGLVSLIMTGGWLAVAIILIICMTALLIGSVYDIFFSNEPNSDTDITLKNVIAEIDAEYTSTIDDIITSNAHDILDFSETQTDWKQVLAVYTVKTATDPDNPMEVSTMDDEKSVILRAVFWDMNSITYMLEEVETTEDLLDDDGLPTGETNTVTKTVLCITVIHKTADEMAGQYNFTDNQNEWLAELLKPEYDDLWTDLLYGIISVDNYISD